MKKILFLLLLIHSNSFSQVMGGSESTINSQFATLSRDISSQESMKNMSFDGNKYFYDDFEFGDIYLSDGEKPISVKTNYNILTETFDIENKEGEVGLALIPNKINSIKFEKHTFIVFMGNFFQLITENDTFSIIKSIKLIAVEQEYQPGIQDVPNLIYRKNDELFLKYKSNKKLIKRNRKSFIAMFSPNKQGEIKKFIKKNKISVRDDKEIKLLFDTYKDDVRL